MFSPIMGIDKTQHFNNTITYRHFTVCFQKRIFSPDRLTAKTRDANRGMVGKSEKSEGRTSIRGSGSCPVVRPAEPGCLSEQSSLCVALLRTRGCTPCDAAHLSLRSHEESSLDARLLSLWLFLFVRRATLDNAKRTQYNYMNFL